MKTKLFILAMLFAGQMFGQNHWWEPDTTYRIPLKGYIHYPNTPERDFIDSTKCAIYDCWRGMGFVKCSDCDIGFYNIECNFKRYEYAHKQPTFEGFIEWLKRK